MLNSIEDLKKNGKIKSDILAALINMLTKKAFFKLMEPTHKARVLKQWLNSSQSMF